MRFTLLSFRQKILISYALVFIIFLTLLLPFASHSVRTIVHKTFKQRALDLISTVSSANNIDDLIEELRFEQQRLFFRVTLLNAKGGVLYDSFAGEGKHNVSRPFPPEIEEALGGSTGYNEEFSPLMGQKLIYVARAFNFRGETLVLRAAFPFKQFDELISDFEIGFLSLGSIILLLFAFLTWMIMHHLSKPIQRIIQLVRPYQEGLQDTIPTIQDRQINEADEFGKLAITLNSLSEKIQGHINTLTLERNNQEIILESLGEGIIAVDNELKVTYANRFALELLDLKKSDIFNHFFDEPQFFQCKDLLNKCQRQKSPLVSSLKIPRKKRFIEILAVPMNSQKGAVLMLQDKSGHYKLLEIGKDFVANASHELKTPITIIRGFAETLADHPDLPREVSLDIVKKIVRNCERMETLVRNLLILADVENLPHSRLQECDLEQLIENSKQMILSVYSSAQIQVNIEKEAPIHIVADPDLLELAIMNLLTNAAKYSSAPARIEVLVASKEGNNVEISIRDHGIGIPQDDLEHIFDRFYTVDKAHSRKLGGSGLGLSITKTIIEKHKGKISAHSILGEGSIFTILLPVQFEDIN